MPIQGRTPQWLLNFLQSQRLLVLATQEAETPYLSLMAFAVTEDLNHLIVATSRGTRKYENIRRHPGVALMIDDRCERGGDFQNTSTVTGFGMAREAEESEQASLTSLFLAKHPELTAFVLSPECVLLKVRMERYLIVRRFENVEEWVLE